jgi:hypothetical protein
LNSHYMSEEEVKANVIAGCNPKKIPGTEMEFEE